MYPGHGRDIEEICGYEVQLVEQLLDRIRNKEVPLEQNDLHMLNKILTDLLESIGVTVFDQ